MFFFSSQISLLETQTNEHISKDNMFTVSCMSIFNNKEKKKKTLLKSKPGLASYFFIVFQIYRQILQKEKREKTNIEMSSKMVSRICVRKEEINACLMLFFVK